MTATKRESLKNLIIMLCVCHATPVLNGPACFMLGSKMPLDVFLKTQQRATASRIELLA